MIDYYLQNRSETWNESESINTSDAYVVMHHYSIPPQYSILTLLISAVAGDTEDRRTRSLVQTQVRRIIMQRSQHAGR